jgi:sortase (surface protein transpeptidase)
MQYAVSQNLLLKPEAFSDLKNVVTENSLVLITCENESVDGGYLNVA